jgi:hypothetical protein
VIGLAAMIRRLLLFALVATSAAAQTWGDVAALVAGTEVRVVAGSKTVSGKVDRVTDSVLTLAAKKAPGNFNRTDISTVSVRKPGHRVRNVLIGVGAGVGIGLAIGLATKAKPDQLHIVPNSAVVGATTGVGAIAGVIVGALIPTGGWREIYKAP